MTATKTIRTKVSGSLAEASSTAAYLSVAATPVPLSEPGLIVPVAEVAIDPFYVVDGTPCLDQGYGTSGVSVLRAALTASGGNPSPTQINTKADGRFLPYKKYVGHQRWWSQGRQYRSYPEIVPRVFSSKGAVGPVVDPAYSWTFRGTRYAQSAFVFNGDGAMDLYTHAGSGVRPSATFIFVLVPHPGEANYWVLWANFSSAAHAQLGIKLLNGRVDMTYEEGRLFSLETEMAAGEAMILGLTLNPTTNTGRLAILDRRRRMKHFDLGIYTSVDYHSRIGAGAALGGGLDQFHGSDFELLEVDWYDRAVPDTELDGYMSNLAAVYGVAR